VYKTIRDVVDDYSEEIYELGTAEMAFRMHPENLLNMLIRLDNKFPHIDEVCPLNEYTYTTEVSAAKEGYWLRVRLTTWKEKEFYANTTQG